VVKREGKRKGGTASITKGQGRKIKTKRRRANRGLGPKKGRAGGKRPKSNVLKKKHKERA